MEHFFATYGMFLLKILTIVVAIVVVLSFIAALACKDKAREKLKICKLNDKYKELRETLAKKIFSKKELKKLTKKEKKLKKKQKNISKKKIFVVDFKGDIKASAVTNLRETITAILQVATPNDEVVVKIESPGGMVHGYGLAASQLRRIKEAKIPLITVVDKVAASGGYLMACVADRIFAAPFAIIGSIGVIAQLPNFNKFLKKHNIDYEQVMAGEYKRTLSLFGENTTKGRAKMQEEVDETHQLFKDFITANRPNLNVDRLATGEHWFGKKALELGLVDKLITSDDYLLHTSETADVYHTSYIIKKKISERFAHSAKTVIDHLWPFANTNNG